MIKVTIAGHDADGGQLVRVVNLTMEEAMEKLMPLSPPTSALAAREMCKWPYAQQDLDYFYMQPGHVILLEPAEVDE